MVSIIPVRVIRLLHLVGKQISGEESSPFLRRGGDFASVLHRIVVFQYSLTWMLFNYFQREFAEISSRK